MVIHFRYFPYLNFSPLKEQSNWWEKVAGVLVPFNIGFNSKGGLGSKVYASRTKLGLYVLFFFFRLDDSNDQFAKFTFPMTISKFWDTIAPIPMISKHGVQSVAFSILMPQGFWLATRPIEFFYVIHVFIQISWHDPTHSWNFGVSYNSNV
jgi:hypothetical protein